MREITIYQINQDKFLVSEDGRGVQTLTSPQLRSHLFSAGHGGKDYKNTRQILNTMGNTTVMTFPPSLGFIKKPE